MFAAVFVCLFLCQIRGNKRLSRFRGSMVLEKLCFYFIDLGWIDLLAFFFCVFRLCLVARFFGKLRDSGAFVALVTLVVEEELLAVCPYLSREEKTRYDKRKHRNLRDT